MATDFETTGGRSAQFLEILVCVLFSLLTVSIVLTVVSINAFICYIHGPICYNIY